jgi:murein DD-endopeptidase MepM/ murein hydrolase activator NlpD
MEATTTAASTETSGSTAARQSLDWTMATLKPGDTLFSVLTSAGVPASEAYRDLAKLKGQINAHRLQPGDRLTLTFVADGNRRRLGSIAWSGKHGGNASAAFLPVAARPDKQSADVAMVLKTIAVYGSPALPRVLTESGLPPQVCEQVMMALSQARRPPVHGEMVKIVYQMPVSPATGPAAQLRYAAYAGRDGKQHVFHYMPLATPAPLQHVDLKPAVMVDLWQPLPGARISSPFGWRVHPVLHTRLFHKGVDYEAAMGTPVIAAADGVVEDVGRRGSYGNYIRIRHSARLETAYAHLSAFAPALDIGAPIHRGDVIGFVGMTGVATGPHLYYELLVDGRQIDPESKALKEATRQRLPQTASVP